MTHPDNGRFTRTIVNRLWYRLTGRGIVHPLDAMQSPPWNEDLLDYLAVRFADDGYDLKKLAVLIVSSNAWQSETVVRRAAGDSASVWQGPTARRLTAEQFIDSVWQVTEAAPTAFDAPVIRVRPEPPGSTTASAADPAATPAPTAKWIWGTSAANAAVPASGEAISLKKSFQLPKGVASAAALITCDNSFILFVNGREVERSDAWEQPRVINLRQQLKSGENTLLAVAANGGSGPNPAGFYLDLRARLESDEQITVVSDESWEFSNSLPAGREGRAGAVKGPWKPAVVVPTLDVWSHAVNNGDARARLQQSAAGRIEMVRASLMKNDFLMRSLGRPHREQIVSMRPDELTTLEAIDLANGAVLANYLRKGSTTLQSRWQADREGLINYLCTFAWSREPSPAEQTAMLDALSPQPTAEEIEDITWTILMTPEFLLVR
ncbi:MAG: hypothetical protein RLZZ458_450 [Planctomycetota bacterium]